MIQLPVEIIEIYSILREQRAIYDIDNRPVRSTINRLV